MARFHSVIDHCPPPEVLDQVAAAWERAHELAARGYDIHFVRRRGRIGADIRRGGTRMQRLKPFEALEFACGNPAVSFFD